MTFQVLGNRQGFALVVVIVILLLLGVIASDFSLAVRSELAASANSEELLKKKFLADAGIYHGLFRLLDRPLLSPDPAESEVLGGKPFTVHVDDETVQVTVTHEAGKLDLNRAPRPLLALFFDFLDLPADEADVFLDSLADWRDADALHRLHGAEEPYYLALTPAYRPRNRPLETVSEARLIRGVEVIAKKFPIDQVFTVHNPQGKIDCNNLSPAMLAFVMNNDEDRMEAYRAAQEVYLRLTPVMMRELMGDERFEELEPYLDFSRNTSGFFTVTAQAEEKHEGGEAAVRITALVRITTSGYRILSWRVTYQ